MRIVRRRCTVGLALVSMLSGTVFVSTAGAAKETVVTGCSPEPFTITAPGAYALAADLGPCPGDGIVVRADNVVVDLRGHRLHGSGDSVDTPKDFAGVRLDGVSRVVVTSSRAGGQVDSFNAGVVIDAGSTSNVVQNLTVHDNVGQLSVARFDSSLGDGIVIRAASGNVVRNNTAHNNGPFSGIAVAAVVDDVGRAIGPNPTDNVITGNTVRDNTLPALACLPAPPFTIIPPPCPDGTSLQPFFQQNIGVRLEGPGAQGNVVSGNTIDRSGADGILLSFVDNTNFPNNEPPLDPPNPENFGNIIKNNTIRDNGFGLPAFSFVPALVGNGIQLLSIPFNFPPNIHAPHHNQVRGNTVTGNKNSGIAVGPQSHSNIVTGNTATGNNVGNAPPSAFGGAFDLKDSNTPTTPPNATPCNGNVWSKNTFGTRNQTVTPKCIS